MGLQGMNYTIILILSSQKVSILSRAFMSHPVPSKTNHKTRNHEQRQLSKRSCTKSQILSPFYKRVIPIILKRGFPWHIPLESREYAVSTCHTILIRLGLCLSSVCSDWQYIIIHISKRCWTEFSLPKMSRCIFVIREHSWWIPAAPSLI